MDMRYLGQNYELSLAVKDGKLDPKSLAKLIAEYHKRHHAIYGYDMPGHAVEVVNLRLVVTVERKAPTHEKHKAARTTVADAVIEKRKVWFPETGYVTTPVYDRDKLPVNARIKGPAIVEQMDTTTVVPPRATLRNDKLGYLHMEVEPLHVKGAN